MRFWFVRHGESFHNSKSLFCGSIDSPLTELGVNQSLHVAQFFVREQIDWVASSPLKRARQTAECVAAAVGLGVTIDGRLTEHTKGVLEGEPYRKMRSSEWVNVDGAEPMVDLYTRVEECLKDLSVLGGVGVVVSHAGVGRAIQAIRRQVEPESLYELKKVGNADPYLVNLY